MIQHARSIKENILLNSADRFISVGIASLYVAQASYVSIWKQVHIGITGRAPHIHYSANMDSQSKTGHDFQYDLVNLLVSISVSTYVV